MGNDKNDNDVDYYVLNPTFTIGKSSLKPSLAYIYSKDASAWASTTGNKEVGVYFVGLDADVDFGMGSAWFTGIYEGGNADLIQRDLSGCAGLSARLGRHGEVRGVRRSRAGLLCHGR